MVMKMAATRIRRGGPRENKMPPSDLDFYKFVINSLPSAVVTVDANLKITGFNPWAEKITGHRSKEVIGHFCGEILKGKMCDAHCPLKTVLDGHEPVSLFDTIIMDKRENSIPVRMNTAGLFDDAGKLIGGVEAFQDITRIKTLERGRDNLISMFAHDIKSSLVLIEGFALRLQKNSQIHGNEKGGKYLEIIRKESGKLETLVSEFLEISRLQTGKLKLNFTPTSVDKELMELCDAYEVKASQSKIRLELKNQEELSIINADSLQLRRVFSNLLENAIKFTDKTGTITLSTHETDQAILVEVKDEGIGIDTDELPYIFDPFHRGKIGGKTEGFGIGLAAVKTIVEGHGGEVRVTSKPGKGAVFTVILPKTGNVK